MKKTTPPATRFSRVLTVLIILKWITLIGALTIAYLNDLWATFFMIFIMVYGNNLDGRINRLKRKQEIVTFDKTFQEKQ